MSLRIVVEPSKHDPLSAKMVLERPIYDGPAMLFGPGDELDGAPLAAAILALDDVNQVLLEPHVITLRKSPESRWQDVAKAAAQALRTLVESGKPVVLPEAVQDSRRSNAPESDGAIAEAVRLILERDINPQVASHGGSISLARVQDRVVFLVMSGGCQGCGAAQMTLKQGVSTTLKNAIPSIQDIVDVTDHSQGDSPFYPRKAEATPPPTGRSSLPLAQ